MPTASPSSNRMFLVGLTVVAIIGASLLFWWALLGWESSQVASFPKEREAAVQSFNDRNFDQALTMYQKLASSTSAAPLQKIYAQESIASTLFETFDEANQMKAIDMMKDIIPRLAFSPRDQANAIHILKGFSCISGRDPDVFARIYSGDTYGAFMTKEHGSKVRAVRDMLMYSYTTYPTARVAGEIAANYAMELLGSNSLTSAEKAQYRNEIIAWQQKAEKLWGRDGNAQSIRQTLLFDGWSGISYGVLALDDPQTYGPHFEASFRDGLEVSSKNNATISTWSGQVTPFLNFYYAYFLQAVYGSARTSDIRAQLNALMKTVDADPHPETNEFLVAIKADNKRDPAHKNDTYEYAIYPFAKSLVTVQPEFGTFLHAHGYKLF